MIIVRRNFPVKMFCCRYLLSNVLVKLTFPFYYDGLGKTEANVWENSRDAVEGFHLLKNSHKLCRGFHLESTDNMFYFFNKIIIFRLNKEKDDTRSVHV